MELSCLKLWILNIAVKMKIREHSKKDGQSKQTPYLSKSMCPIRVCLFNYQQLDVLWEQPDKVVFYNTVWARRRVRWATEKPRNTLKDDRVHLCQPTVFGPTSKLLLKYSAVNIFLECAKKHGLILLNHLITLIC